MMKRDRRGSKELVVAAMVTMLGAPACDFLDVSDPNVITMEDFDPTADPRVLSFSARQNFTTAAGMMGIMTGFVVWEVWNGFPTVGFEDFGLRAVPAHSTFLDAQLWRPISMALRSSDEAAELLGAIDSDPARLETARSFLFAGYSLLHMGDAFCVGVINGGPALSLEAMMDSAVVRFTRAVDLASAVRASASGSMQQDAAGIVNAALVGRARSHLQAGRGGPAIVDAEQVDSGFRYDLLYVDDAAARVRLSNPYWRFTVDQRLVVAPGFRVEDPRVPWIPAAPGSLTVDGVLEFHRQAKHDEYAAPIRLASKIEADYIAAEALGTDAMLELIQERRHANDQPPYEGSTDPGAVLAEFMEQRGREFFLEGKRIGDFRRHPESIAHVPEPGTEYYKPGFGSVGSQTCLPLPSTETANNPNIP